MNEPTKKGFDVFISYRRSDSSDRANLIRNYLTQWFESDRIFLDTHEIHEGPFPSYLEDALESVKYFIVIISNDSFGRKENDGKTDYYVEEIHRALKKGKVVIPVVYDNIDFHALEVPEKIESLKLQNAIFYHADDPEGLQKKLHLFTKKKKKGIADWLKFPLAIITIYLMVSLLAGLGLFVYDRCFISHEEMVEIAKEHVQEQNGQYYYILSGNRLKSYNAETQEINLLGNKLSNGNTITYSDDDLYRIGFWSIATGLIYNVVKSKYKPHNGKQMLAYLGAAVSVVAGVGLGMTLERMLFPQYSNPNIEKNLDNPEFWQEIIEAKYKHTNDNVFYE